LIALIQPTWVRIEMSPKREARKGNPQPVRRSNTSVLTIAFAIAMAIFLVIGMIAVAVPEFLGGRNDTTQQAPVTTLDDDAESEEDRLRERLEEDPEDASALILLADLLANTGRYDESIRYYERAIEQRPEQVSLRIAFSQTLERRGYDLDAEVQLERALEIEPENEQAMFMLAEIMERDDPPRREEADELYERIIETSPESFYAELAEERLADDPDADDATEGN
jgi:tetratricopeptide (TPR) repeat protein